MLVSCQLLCPNPGDSAARPAIIAARRWADTDVVDVWVHWVPGKGTRRRGTSDALFLLGVSPVDDSTVHDLDLRLDVAEFVEKRKEVENYQRHH